MTSLGMNSLIALVTIQGFALLVWMSTGSDNKSEVNVKDSNGKAEQQGSERQRLALMWCEFWVVGELWGCSKAMRFGKGCAGWVRNCAGQPSGVVECSGC